MFVESDKGVAFSNIKDWFDAILNKMFIDVPFISVIKRLFWYGVNVKKKVF